ncbi:hypothetical protein SAMN05421690_10351 [Nitrosomonas sp. Nm51]|uniref:hypothetical protein n=1 Tax=Nitrosomonas sp. Nm51 TaxID=133720 RepID=UPI0008ADB9E2|nr:hypothetical protein [Nitrosomonas sp. Nm51]SER52832.1 hypothetical protein SAMN05421690_10351 [Nitrosomonas sp. Nm51]
MKVVSGCRWIAKLVGIILISVLALPVYAQLMLAHEGHHDAGGCEIKDGEFPMTFSGYEVPEGDIPPLHSYCSNIPKPGKVQLTVELPDWDSREIPLAVRLVEAGHSGQGHSGHEKHQNGEADDANTSASETAEKETDHSGHDAHEMHGDHGVHDKSEGDPGENDIVYMPYAAHNSGIIVVSAELQKGHYEILLERKNDADEVVVAGRVPFAVGGSGGGHAGHGGGFGVMEIGLVALVVGGAAFYFMRRKTAAKGENKS